MGEEAPETKPVEKPAPNPDLFQISKADVVSDFSKFRELHEKASAAGQTVTVLD
jgi:hypothetical protein